MTELPDLTGRGDHVLLRRGDELVAAPPEDQDVVRGYPGFSDKGAVVDGYRITLLVSQTSCRPGESVRVLHVCESTSPDRPLYVMGPKPVTGEYVDERLATDPPSGEESAVVPASYDGRVQPGPGIDTNYDITEYRFDQPGRHTIQWRLGPLVSNTITVEVTGELQAS